jgi:uncharacterized protein (TIGR02594 family)
MNVTAFDLAQRFVGIKEVPGSVSNPGILAMLQLDGAWPKDDSVPWCSAFTNYIAWLLRLPRSKSLAARSWLAVGRPIGIHEARAGNDVVILKRGDGPGAEVLQAPGHVGFFAGYDNPKDMTGGARVLILGGNQSDGVSVAPFKFADVLGVRRLL